MVNPYDELVLKFPILYRYACFIECGQGWYKIIHDLSEKLQNLIEKEPYDMDHEFYAEQVKEKFGTLRFYLSRSTPEMGHMILEAEEISSKTCDRCGEPGTLRGSRWFFVSCDKCDTIKELREGEDV